MKSWKTQSLESLGTVVTGSTPRTAEASFYGSEIPFVTPADLDGTEPIVKAARYLSVSGGKEARLLPEGAVMVSCIGTLGKVGYAGRTVATNQQINAVIFEPTIIWSRFGYYACRLLKKKLNTMAPATTLPIVSKSKFSKLEILFPSLPEQRRIAAILDKADELRAKRRAALAHLDSLAQSIFIDMFGDPTTNTKKWEVATLASVLTEAKSGFACGENPSKGTFQIRMNNVTTSGNFDFSKKRRVPGDSPNINTFLLSPGDVLFNATNSPELVGKSAIFQDCGEPVVFSNHFLRLRTKPKALNGFYLLHWLLFQFRRKIFMNICKQWVNQATVGRDTLLGKMIMLPPINLQEEFALRIKHVDGRKMCQQNSLFMYEELFAVLQHRAFRGEL